MKASAKLYLIPVPIADFQPLRHIPAYNLDILRSLKIFVAEDAKTARAHLKTFGYQDIPQAEIHLLNEHSRPEDLRELSELFERGDIGLMSDAGCPGIADPGALMVSLAHKKNAEVVPLAGPSSIMLAVMSSGFDTQRFAFNGYLPVDRGQRSAKIRELEQSASRQGLAQFFIETPYRNRQMWEAMLNSLLPSTLLFVGASIGSQNSIIRTRTVGEWAKSPIPALDKVPAVFGIYPAGGGVRPEIHEKQGAKKRKFTGY